MARPTLILPRVTSPLFYERVAAVWHFDETTGNAADGLKRETLTANSAPGTIAGKLGNARSLVRNTANFFSKTDDAVLSVGDLSMAWSLWWFHQAQTGTAGDAVLVSKYSSPAQRSYRFYWAQATALLTVQLSSDGSNSPGSFISLNGPAIPAFDAWAHYVWGFDKTAQLAKLYVNGALAASTAHTGGMFDNTTALEIGRGGAANLAADGYVDEVIFWKDYFPTQNEVARLYNAGNGWRMPIG